MFVGSYKKPVSPPTAHKNVGIHVRDQGVQTYSLYAFLGNNFPGQLNGITSRYSTGFVAGVDLLSDEWLCRRSKDDLARGEPTVN